jgi:hypothetical protein
MTPGVNRNGGFGIFNSVGELPQGGTAVSLDGGSS